MASNPDSRPADMGNVDLVRAMLEAVGRGDVETMVGLCHSEYESIPLMAALEGKVYRGPSAVREWFADVDVKEIWEVFVTHAESFHPLGDRVLAFGRWEARARGSGIELNVETAAWLAEIRDGRIYRWRTFTDPQDALHAAGLSRLPSRPPDRPPDPDRPPSMLPQDP